MRDLIAELQNLKQLGELKAEEPFLTGDMTPLSEDMILHIEDELGYKVPNLMRDIYTQIANGGFGPDYGLIGLKGGVLESGRDVLDIYFGKRKSQKTDPYWFWPEKLLPINSLGCAMYACVDCSKESLPVILFEPNPHEFGTPWDDSFIPFADSLEEWLFSFIDEENVFEKYLSGSL